MKSFRNQITISNMITVLRLLFAGILLFLAFFDHRKWFLGLLVLTLIADALDGFTARILDQSSPVGAKLDSFADLITYIIVPICVWLLWPSVIIREKYFIMIILGAYAIPVIVGILKFHCFPSYHTWLEKTIGLFLCSSLSVLLIVHFHSMFRIAAVLELFVGLESIGITMISKNCQSDVPSVIHSFAATHIEKLTENELEEIKMRESQTGENNS